MKKSISLEKRTIEYTLTTNSRSKRVRLAVRSDGSVKVSSPRYVPHSFVEEFIMSRSKWVVEKVDFFLEAKKNSTAGDTHAHFLQYKDQAKKLVLEKIENYNKVYNFKWNNVTIKNQRTRWGSCSKYGNLNFNYKIALLPAHLAEYIVVHELCHLKELNHGDKFWNLVARTVPNYLEARKELHKSGLTF